MKKYAVMLVFCFFMSLGHVGLSQTSEPAFFSPSSWIEPSLDNFLAFPQLQWEQHYASGLAPSVEVPMDMVVDGSGNVYVTGYSTSGLYGTDFCTIKYNAAGAVVWMVRYNGEANGDDAAYAIFLDIKNNIYVTGYSVGSATGLDFCTIKYDNQGVQQWAVRYNGGGSSSDYAEDIAVDVSANIYVTGSSVGVNSDYDLVTVKYNPFGVQQWVDRYNGPANLKDYAEAIGIDKSGNVFVTGQSNDSNTYYDFVTLKYTSAGAIQWTKRYNGSGNDLDGPREMVIDGSGNIYVTGYSEGNGTGHDFVTIKYNNADGAEFWVSRYNRSGSSSEEAIDLAVDRYGNVFVTGQSKGSGTDWDYATVMYNSSGVEQWVSRYNGQVNSYDYPKAIELDQAGHIYVTGESYDTKTGRDFTTVKYDLAGVPQWVKHYNGSGNAADIPAALCVDATGNIYVTGASNGLETGQDYATIKYNSAGNDQWVARYNGPGNSYDEAAAMKVDGAGNVYVAGKVLTSTGGEDFVLVKYAADGRQQWASRKKGVIDGEDYPTALCVDNDGNIYVTGVSTGATSGSDYLTIKYNTEGSEQWAVSYNGPDNGTDEAVAIGVDGFGNVFVTGKSQYTNSGYDVVTLKYRSNGTLVWDARFQGSGTSSDLPNAMSVDRLGNVYICGSSGSPPDYLMIKYNTLGTERWAHTYDGPAQSTDVAEDIAIDSQGNVYVTGYSMGIASSYDYATIKYNATGDEQWVQRYNGSDNTWDKASALYVSDSANVYVTGSSSKEIGEDSDYLTVKYNAGGAVRWIRRFNGVGNTYDEAVDVAVDGMGNVYVLGRNSEERESMDYTTVLYDANGALTGAARYLGLGCSLDTPESITLDDQGNAYIAGSSGYYVWSVFTVLKYSQSPTSAHHRNLENPADFRLYMNHPNPFNEKTSISFRLSTANPVELTIYNLLGEKVATLTDEMTSAGIHRVVWNGLDQIGREVPSGVFISRLQVGQKTASIKMLLLR